MKFLFIVQGEGRGHLTQALALEEMLSSNGHQVVEVLVGRSTTRRLPGFFNRNIQAPVKRFISPYHPYVEEEIKNQQGVDFLDNLWLIPEYYRSMRYIYRRIEASGADAVINFYELLTGLTYALFRPTIPYVCVGHQYLFLHSAFKAPDCSNIDQFILNLYTRCTSLRSAKRLALSFVEMPTDEAENIMVIPPLLRRDVTSMIPEEGDYIQGYLLFNRFASQVEAFHNRHPDVSLHFFWDNIDADDVKIVDQQLNYHQIDDLKFMDMMAKCKGFATTAGFESICEAMYLGKPVQMIPTHIEQQFNAADASRSGAGIVSDQFEIEHLLDFADTYQPNQEFIYWVKSCERLILEKIEDTVRWNARSDFQEISDCITA